MFKEGKLWWTKCNGMFNSSFKGQASALTNVNKHEKMFAVNGCLRTVY